MKRPVILILFSLMLLPSISFKWSDHCNSDALLKEVHAKFKDFTLLKDYLIYLKPKKATETDNPTMSFPISLTSGLKYKFVEMESDGYAGKLTMHIYSYENMQKGFLEASNIEAGTGKEFNSIQFVCHSSGTYLIEFSFNGEEGCGVAASGFAMDK